MIDLHSFPTRRSSDLARYGFRCCHLKNIWTAPLPPETELSRQMTTSTTSIDIMGLQAQSQDRKSGSAGMPRPISYAVFCLKKKKNKKTPKNDRRISWFVDYGLWFLI